MRLPHRSSPHKHALLFLLIFLLSTSIVSTHASGNSDDEYWQINTSLTSPQGFVDAMVIDGGDLYVGGNFAQIGGQAIHHVARWDGSQWNAIGGGVGTPEMGIVHRIIVDANEVWVAGCFDMVGGTMMVCNIAMWNGVMWDMLGGGTDRAVRAIAKAPNGDLYAGGEFTMAGGAPARGIARWDGQQWHALGAGIDNHVSAIAIHGNNVYVGGAFRAAGGQFANYVARWDGANWHTMGIGVNHFVTALATSGSDVYVGGLFTTAGLDRANGIARWDGSNWSPLGSGVSGPSVSAVREIYVDGNNLFVGGLFRFAGGNPADHVARWNGSAWYPLGSGTDRPVKTFARHSTNMLYVGGEFFTAGGKASHYIAHWTKLQGVPVYFLGFFARLVDQSVELTWDVSYDEPIDGFRIYRSSAGQPREQLLNNISLIQPDARQYTDDQVVGSVEYRYVLSAVKPDGSEVRSQTATVKTPAVLLTLDQNYPNPFNPATTIRFTLPNEMHVTLEIYDARGERVTTLIDGVRPEGVNSITWNARNEKGHSASTGVYFYKLSAGSFTHMKKMVLLQ